MAYEIKRSGRVVETHQTMPAATRAFWILTAQELKHCRLADYELDTKSCDCVQMLRRAELPDWAADVLASYDLLAE